MLEQITIKALGVIEAAELKFQPGFTVITGETGAGKTMILGALGLLLGERADPGLVRSGAEVANVEGSFRLTPAQLSVVAELGGEVEEVSCWLARRVWAAGRSRAFIGGVGVSLTDLAEVGRQSVAIHGQADQLRLRNSTTQRETLDTFGGAVLEQKLNQYQASYLELTAVTQKISELTASARERMIAADQLQYSIAEIKAVAPEVTEVAELSLEENKLAQADELRQTVQEAKQLLTGDDAADFSTGLAKAAAALTKLDQVDPKLAEFAQRTNEISYLVTDLAADLASYQEDIVVDPQRLAAVSQRRADLANLTRKYGATITDVLNWLATAESQVFDFSTTEAQLLDLTAEKVKLGQQTAQLAGELSALRVVAASKLANQVTETLTELAMGSAQLIIEVKQRTDPAGLVLANGDSVAASHFGIDEIEFLFQANPGLAAAPLAKSASGGELSRIMLAIELALAGENQVATFVFDEIDAGVGGKAAIAIGQKLAELAQQVQVIVITHLPQVAAFANQHLRVAKAAIGAVTVSDVELLTEDERVTELSRMLAGLEGSETATAHAEELLAIAQGAK